MAWRTAEAVATSEALCREHRFGLWAVRLKDQASIAGFAGIWPFREPPEFELLYGVGERYWGRGLAVEASRAVLDKLGFARVRRDTVGGLDTLFFERVW